MDLNKLLPYVQKPSRYIGGEWNARNNKWNAYKSSKIPLASICLCFPDLYELGTSSLGFEILYRAINSEDEFIAERCYAPDLDFENILKTKGFRLFSIESKTPLKNFDLIGFTLQYELCLTNVLSMLELSGIEIFSKDRTGFPLVIGGGPLSSNPEPVADFFDAIVIGDGEEVLVEIMGMISKLKNSSLHLPPKYDILKKLSTLKGVYVPSFYEPVYENGVFSQLKKNEASAPDFIEKRIFDLNKKGVDWDASPVIPNTESVHSRLNIEIARGCPHNCSFCQAKSYYWPYRRRPISVLKKAVEIGLKNTGYDEFAFTSLTSGDYPNIAKLISEVLSENKNYPLSVSLPSLHCENFSKELADALSKSSSRPSLTFAPEAGSEKLRFSIGKSLTDEMIFFSISNAVSANWKNIKLYFMYGLPNETQEDLEAIVKLVSEIKKRFPGLKIKLTLSPFVPKPQTNFERATQDTIETLKKKLEYLKKNLRIPLSGSAKRFHGVESAFIEGLFARADRRAAQVIFRAYKNGCRFDQWQDRFNFANWLKSFEEEKINPFEYINRFSAASPLPWAHIKLRPLSLTFTINPAGKNSLATPIDIGVNSYTEKIVEDIEKTPTRVKSLCYPCRYSAPFVVGFTHNTPAPSPLFTSIRYRFRISRSSLARYISHNDQADMFRRAVRRAELPVNFSKGFSPQPKISFGPAISVGHESEAEYFEAEFLRYESPEKIFSRIAEQMPEGFRVLAVKQVPTVFPSLESLCNVADYIVIIPSSINAVDVVVRFNGAENLIYQKSTGGSKYDLKSVVREIKAVSDDSIYISQFLIPGKSLKPEKLLSYLLSPTPFVELITSKTNTFSQLLHQPDKGCGVDEKEFLVKRLKFYTVKKDGTLLEL